MAAYVFRFGSGSFIFSGTAASLLMGLGNTKVFLVEQVHILIIG